MENITTRITYWSARILSYAGRVQLIKVVLFGMQTFWDYIFKLPNKIIKMIDVICRSFLWIGVGHLSKKSLVPWEKLCYPRSVDGLNMINIRLWNKAEVMK